MRRDWIRKEGQASWEIFMIILSSVDFFQNFLKKTLSETQSQAKRPDLGPNWF